MNGTAHQPNKALCRPAARAAFFWKVFADILKNHVLMTVKKNAYTCIIWKN